MKLHFIRVTLLALWAFSVVRSEIVSLSLSQCIERTLEFNKSIRNSNLDVEIAKTRFCEVGSLYLPRIAGSMSLNKNIERQTMTIGSGPQTMSMSLSYPYDASIGASASLTLVDVGLIYSIKAASYGKQLARAGNRAVKEQVVMGVSATYYQAIITDYQLSMIDTSLGAGIANRDAMIHRRDQGFATQLDVDRMELLVANLASQREMLRKNRILALLRLKDMIGLKFYDSLTLCSQGLILDTTSIDTQLDSAMTKRTDVAIKSATVAMSKASLLSSRSSFLLPSLVLSGRFSNVWQADSIHHFYDDDKWQNVHTIGLQLTWPLVDGRAVAKLRESHLKLRQSENELAAMRQSVAIELSSAEMQVTAARRSVITSQSALAIANATFTTLSNQYRLGLIGMTDLSSGQESLTTAQVNYISALVALAEARLSLAQANGTLLSSTK